MIEMSAIAGVLSSLKAAKDIAEAMVTLRDAAAIQTKVIEFQSKILDAQSSAFAANEERSSLIETVGTLKKQVADLEAWEAEKQRYNLAEVGFGVVAYAPKPEMQRAEPFHLLCAHCFERRKKSFLQATQRLEMRLRVHFCPECKTEYAFSYVRPVPANPIPWDYDPLAT